MNTWLIITSVVLVLGNRLSWFTIPQRFLFKPAKRNTSSWYFRWIKRFGQRVKKNHSGFIFKGNIQGIDRLYSQALKMEQMRLLDFLAVNLIVLIGSVEYPFCFGLAAFTL